VAADSIATTIPSWLPGLGANGALLLGSYWIARHGCRQTRGLHAVLGTAVVFWAVSTVGLEILGTAGAIRPGALLILGAVALAAGWGIRRSFPAIDRDSLGQRSMSAEATFSWDAVAGLALLLSAALVLGMRSLLLAVKVVSDGPIYHLYFAVRWWKAGRLFLVAAPFGENAATYFPANGDLWFTWLITAWGGDRLARVGQAPFLVLASLAAFGCARLLGAGRSASLVATCWFASSTPLLLYSFEPNVDTIFVAGYLIAAFFFLRASRDPNDPFAIFHGALAAGEALGTKAVGVVFVPPLLAVAIAVILFQSVPVRTKLARTLVVLFAPLLTGGYWYFRNTLLTGNPVYPLEVRLLGQTILPGWYGPDAMHLSHYYVPFGDWRFLVDTVVAVFDPRLAPLWLFSVAAAWAAAIRKNGWLERWSAIFSVLAILNISLYWLCIPYRTQQRFMLQALGLAVVPLALFFDRSRWLRYLGVALLGLHLLTPENWPFPDRDDAIPWDLSPMVPNAVRSPIPIFSRYERAFHAVAPHGSALGFGVLCGILVVAMLLAWAWGRTGNGAMRPWGRIALVIAISAAFVWSGYEDVWIDGQNARIIHYPPFANFFIGWQHLERLSGSTGSRVAYAGTNIPYYLMGRDLRNDVRYINIDRHRDWLMHDYHREAMARGEGNWPNPRPGWDRARPESEAWVENLDADGIQFLVVTHVDPAEGAHNVADAAGFPIERQWADRHPERFEPVYGREQNDPWFRIYRFRPSKNPRSRTDRVPRSHSY
jgi:hypothetical protein